SLSVSASASPDPAESSPFPEQASPETRSAKIETVIFDPCALNPLGKPRAARPATDLRSGRGGGINPLTREPRIRMADPAHPLEELERRCASLLVAPHLADVRPRVLSHHRRS